MATGDKVNRIIEILRDLGLPWLLPNLRQDFILWNALNEPAFIDRLIQVKPSAPHDFSPGNLALLALDHPRIVTTRTGGPLDVLDRPVVNLAIHSAEARQALGPAAQDLASAGLVALSALENYGQTHSWHTLLETTPQIPERTWLAAVACLYSFLDVPGELLKHLLRPGSSRFEAGLAVHAILSNPIPPEEMLKILVGLCRSADAQTLPPAERMNLLGELVEQWPSLAADFSRMWLEMSPGLPGDGMAKARRSDQLIAGLLENLFLAEVWRSAGDHKHLPGLLESQLAITGSIYGNFLNQYLRLKVGLPGDLLQKKITAGLLAGADRLSELAFIQETNPPHQAEMALILAEHGQLDQASTILSLKNSSIEDIDRLYAIARVSLLAGDRSNAEKAASSLVELFDRRSKAFEVPVWGDGLSHVNFAKLLLELQRPSEAVQVLERALQTCPNEPALLQIYAGACSQAHLYQKAVASLAILVDLNPGDMDNRRAYARSLESQGDFAASLEQWATIISSSQQDGHACQLADEYAYAHSAIETGRPELAANVCEALLEDNPEDSQALIYFGKASLLMGDGEKGLQSLVQATQIAPQSAQAWIELAQAQRKLFPIASSIETLIRASQALPDASEIHYLLGDFYLQDNAPTLALPQLQSAVELSPENVQALARCGDAFTWMGQAERGREVFARAYRLDPDFPGLAQSYTDILLGMGLLEEALAPLETLLKTNNLQDPSLYMSYARCNLTLIKLGSAAASPLNALVALNQVLQVEPQNAEAKALTAEALAANGENELAFQAYREALDTLLIDDKAWFVRLSFGFGCVAGSLGKQDIAIAALQEASQVDPANPAILMALSDAYLSANLAEDAVRTARNVLVIDGESPDKLAWFASQVARLGGGKNLGNSGPMSESIKDVLAEALSALYKAIQLAPTETRLVVQLGYFQASIGEAAEARQTFASIAGLQFATVDDLVSAAKYLGDIGDHRSAIDCLDRGITIAENQAETYTPELYASLAGEYVKDNDQVAALRTLDTAIELFPGDSSLISLKAGLLLGADRPQDALSFIDSSLQVNLEPSVAMELLFLASRINLSMGNLPASMDYASRGASLSNVKKSGSNSPHLLIQHRMHLAELYRLLLQPRKAFDLLQNAHINSRADFATEQDFLDFVFLHAELALETGERIRPDIQDVKLEGDHICFSRWMAINARLMNRAGNYVQAEQIFQLAIIPSQPCPSGTDQPGWNAGITRRQQQRSFLEAAQDLGLWDQAMAFAKQAVETEPGEPLAHLNLAKTLVLEAEFSHLCELFDVHQHNPSVHDQLEEMHRLCRHYLEQAQANLAPSLEFFDPIDPGIQEDQFARWSARAAIIFGHPTEGGGEPDQALAPYATPGDSAAVIDYLVQRLQDNDPQQVLTRIIQLARPYPRNPAVMLHVALALRECAPQEANKTLLTLQEHNPNSKNPALAFCHVLSARISLASQEFTLAEQAMEQALSFWPDEDGWQSFAAQICAQGNHIQKAVQHLQEAVRLAPGNTSYLVELGQLLFEFAGDDIGQLHQALAAFESANALEPDNLAVQTRLASIHFLLNNLDQADAWARAVLAKAPEQSQLFPLLSKIAIQKNDFQGAYEYATKAVQVSPGDAQSTVTLARALSAMGRRQEALDKLDAAITLVHDALPLRLERVSILHKISGPQVAIQELRTLTVKYPDDFTILCTLARSLFEVGELENSVAVAQRALNTQTGSVSANELANLHLLIGQVLRQLGQLDQSIQYLNDAIRFAPNRLEPYLELGLARKERREYQQALHIFEQASAIAPNDPRALFQAGLALKESKDYKSSETMLRRAVDLAPHDLAIRRQLAAVVALNLIHNPRSARNSAK